MNWILVTFALLGAPDAPMPGAVPPSPDVVPPRASSEAPSRELLWEGGFSLEQACDLAEQNSPVLRAATAEIVASRGRTLQSGLYPNPVLEGGSPQWGANQTQFYSMLTQEIVTKRKLQLNRAAESRTITQAEQRFLRARYDVFTNVRKSFYAALASQRRSEILETMVEISERSRQAALALQRGGEGTVIDTLFLEVELERARVAQDNAVSKMVAHRRQLSAHAGLPGHELPPLVGQLTADLCGYADEQCQRDHLSLHGELMAQSAEIDRWRALIRRAEVEPYPNVNVGAGYMHQPLDPSNYALFQTSIALPIWNRNQGNIVAARANYNKASEEYQKQYNTLVAQLAESIGRLQVAETQTAKYQVEILPRAQRSLELTQKAYQQGQFDVLKLLQAQRVLIEARLQFVAALEDRWQAAAEIAGLTQREQFP